MLKFGAKTVSLPLAPNQPPQRGDASTIIGQKTAIKSPLIFMFVSACN